jgi:hypothetical protein
MLGKTFTRRGGEKQQHNKQHKMEKTAYRPVRVQVELLLAQDAIFISQLNPCCKRREEEGEEERKKAIGNQKGENVIRSIKRGRMDRGRGREGTSANRWTLRSHIYPAGIFCRLLRGKRMSMHSSTDI